MEFTEDPEQIAQWAPLLVDDRDPGRGGRGDARRRRHRRRLRRAHAHDARRRPSTRAARALHPNHEVTWLKPAEGRHVAAARRRPPSERARAAARSARGSCSSAPAAARSRCCSSSGIPEIKGFGGFPICGPVPQTTNPQIVAQHQAKVYGKAAVGAPPMSVPHLDTRVVDGETALLFGPYAGFSPKFLKHGSLVRPAARSACTTSARCSQSALENFDLVKYLVGEVLAEPDKKIARCASSCPPRSPSDWELITAGQRVQVMKKDPRRAACCSSAPRSSPPPTARSPACSAPPRARRRRSPTMLDLLERCFPDRIDGWEPRLREMIPSLGGGAWDESFELDQLVDDEQVGSDR